MLFKLKDKSWAEPYDQSEPIDAVITWVDMTDPIWLEKYQQAMGVTGSEEISKARYRSFRELWFSVESLKKFCSWIRNIYIVTDGQVPDFINFEKSEKETIPNVILIDHDQILGPDCCRPTFKSTSIESYLYRIEGLSEVFLYLNDDMSVGKKIRRDTLIDPKDGIPWVELGVKNLNLVKASRTGLFLKKPWERHIFNAAGLIVKKFGRNPNLTYIHQMTVVRKSCCELAWQLFPKALVASVTTPTRKPNLKTISFIPLSQYLGILYGKLKFRNTMNISKNPHQKVFLGHQQMRNREITQKSLNRILKSQPHLICINSVNEDNCEIYWKFSRKYLDKIEI
jgi:hypothetical protein